MKLFFFILAGEELVYGHSPNTEKKKKNYQGGVGGGLQGADSQWGKMIDTHHGF